MKKIVVLFVVSLFFSVGYAQIKFGIVSESFTRPDTVVFLNTTVSASTPTSLWEFPGGSVSSSNDLSQPQVTVIYKKPGHYSVRLQVDTGASIIDTTVNDL